MADQPSNISLVIGEPGRLEELPFNLTEIL